MTFAESSMSSMIEEAERLGKEQALIDERNRKRRAKGRKPLPDLSEAKDLEIGRKAYRSGDTTTVDGKDAIALYMMRKEAMMDGRSDDPSDTIRRLEDLVDGNEEHEGSSESSASDVKEPVKTVSSAAHVSKGKANHPAPSVSDAWATPAVIPPDDTPSYAPAKQFDVFESVSASGLESFKADLFQRLGDSFRSLERALADLCERVSKAFPEQKKEEDRSSGKDEFEALLEKKTPVLFDIGGTQLSFDAICVFHASPCITVVSRIGSARISPKPGASLLLSYEMDGVEYKDDPVTYLGTRFELPMFGLAFVGFIRDKEADVIDADSDGMESSSNSPQSGQPVQENAAGPELS